MKMKFMGIAAIFFGMSCQGFGASSAKDVATQTDESSYIEQNFGKRKLLTIQVEGREFTAGPFLLVTGLQKFGDSTLQFKVRHTETGEDVEVLVDNATLTYNGGHLLVKVKEYPKHLLSYLPDELGFRANYFSIGAPTGLYRLASESWNHIQTKDDAFYIRSVWETRHGEVYMDGVVYSEIKSQKENFYGMKSFRATEKAAADLRKIYSEKNANLFAGHVFRANILEFGGNEY